MGEEFVEFLLAEDGAQRGLGELGSLVQIVGNFDYRLAGINHAQEDDGIYFQRDVVAGDDVLGRNFECFLAQRDPHDAVDGCEDENDAWTFRAGKQASEAENDATLIFGEDLDRAQQVNDDDDSGNKRQGNHAHASSGSGRKTPLSRIVP